MRPSPPLWLLGGAVVVVSVLLADPYGLGDAMDALLRPLFRYRGHWLD